MTSSQPPKTTESAEDQQFESSEPQNTSQPTSSAQPPSMFPPRDPNRTGTPNGYGIIHQNHIYAIPIDSDLGREYEKLKTKEEKREFMISKGEKRGKIDIDMRRKAPDQVYG